MTKAFREQYAREESNFPVIPGMRHCVELPNGWFVVIDLRDDSDPWSVAVLDSTGEHIQDVEIPAKRLKGIG